MSTDLAKTDGERDRLDLIKRTVAKGATDDELRLFLYQAKRTGLDPLSAQIHFIKRWDSTQGKEVGRVQTGIDGLRLIATRTGHYRPDDEAPRFDFDKNGELVSARVRIYILAGPVTQREWFPVEAIAFYQEYVQINKDGKPFRNWARMPRLMLAKCAEALALRKAFPAELSGVYASDELPDDAETGSVPGARVMHVDTETGEILEAGSTPVPTTPNGDPVVLDKATLFTKLNDLIPKAGLNAKSINDKAREMTGKAMLSDLTVEELARLVAEVEGLVLSTAGTA